MKIMKIGRCVSLPFVAAGAVLGMQDAMAQTTDSTGVLEEVVITAQKREENLQKTPIAITALDPEQMAREGVKDFTNIDKLAPDVQVGRFFGSIQVGIRGIYPVANSPTTESPNAVHIDGVYIDRPTGLDGLFYDVQRIEVLKGPQGTLYGRNTASGAVNIITNDPKPEFGAGLDVEGGNFNLFRAEGFLNMPVTDGFALRLAVRDYRHDGYYDGNDFSDADQQSARLKGLWTLSDTDRLLLGVDYQRIRQGGTPGSSFIGSTSGATVTNLTTPSDPYDANPLFPNGDPYYFDVDHWGLMAQYDHEFGPATLTAQVAHRDLAFALTTPTLAARRYGTTEPRQNPLLVDAQAALFYNYVNARWSSFEARLASSSKQPLEWLAGIYVFGSSSAAVATNYQPPGVESFSVNNPVHHARSYAAFGQATWTPWNPLHFTLGLRYNYDWKEAATSQSFGAGSPLVYNPATYPTNGDLLSDHWTKTTGRFGVSYDITDANMIYASVSTGYQAGGYAFGSTPKYNPENNTAYEIGTKNRFLNDRLQVNAEAYHYNYKDKVVLIQRLTLPSNPNQPTSIDLSVTNAGKLEYDGASVDTIWALTSVDAVSLSAAYLDARYTDYIAPAATPVLYIPTPGGTIPIVASAAVNASNTPQTGPKWTGRVAYKHTFMFGAGSLDLNIGGQYRGKSLLVIVNPQCGTGADLVTCTTAIPTATTRRIYEDDFWIGDVSMRFAASGDKWSVTAYVNNISDEQKLLRATLSSPDSVGYPQEGMLSGNYIQPRTFGVIASVRF